MSSIKVLILRHGQKILLLLLFFMTLLALLTISEHSVRQMTSLSSAPWRKSRPAGDPMLRNRANGISGNLPTRVLVVAYYRSGSTLTGSIFDDLKEAFYNFEPLYPLYVRSIASHRPLTYFNGSTSKCPDGPGEDRPVAKDILSGVFDCRFQDLDVNSIRWMQCAVITNSSPEFCECKMWKQSNYTLTKCIPSYAKLCLTSAYRVIKTIRVDMDTVESLLQIYPDLKIIHLLRDPRGRVCSGIVARNCNVTEQYVQTLCDIGTRDVLNRKILEEKYPRSFKEVIYEEMVADPVGISEDIYTFVGAKLPNYIKVILQNKTQKGDINTGPYGTYRKNGLETAYKWSKSIPWSVMEYVNRHCEQLIELGNFPVLRTKEELMSFKIPDRRKLQNDLKL